MEIILDYFGQWTWFIIAGILLLLELAVPGIVFIWLGVAAVGTGLIDLVVPMNWQVELVVFSALAAIFLLIARPIVMKRITDETDQPNLNNRIKNFIGKRFQLAEPISGGTGILNINDTRWKIRGDDCPTGSWVTITEVDGLELIVSVEDS